jgi:UDP-GlcNAc:undecaprenyl-phosphate GlcNAc-1-phosphate transferase
MQFLLALAFALVLTPLARKVGLAAGVVDRPDGEGLKIHAVAVPLLGGLAAISATLAAMAIGRWWLPGAALAAILAATGIGLLDDVRPLPPWFRMVALVAVGILLAMSRFGLEPLGVLGGVGVVLLVLGSTNGVNLLDGQDGLVGGLAAIAALGLSAIARINGADGTTLGLALGGGLAGFLVWNRPPARIFLGNSGAYGVGAALSVLASAAARNGGLRSLLATGLCLAVPAFELVFTVARRTRVRERLGRGDRFHSYDLLARRLGNRSKVTVLFWGVGAVAALAGATVAKLPLTAGTTLAGIVVIVAFLLSVRLWGDFSHQVRWPL